MKYRFEREGKTQDIDVEVTSEGFVLRGADGVPHSFSFETRPDGSQRARTPWGEL